MNKKKFFLTPPPNLTGELHTGHILNLSIQDFILSYSKIFKNEEIKSVFGFDHAGLYAEIIAKKYLEINEKQYFQEKKFDKKYSSEILFQQIEINNNYFKNKIINQIKNFNFNLDLTNYLYTFDETAKKIVQNKINYLQENNIIKQKDKLLNYDFDNNTFISDSETYYKKINKTMFYIEYDIFDSEENNLKEHIVVATTMPNTIESDIRLAVNPLDKRYLKLIGKYAINPISGKKIKIINHNCVDINFGTGILKITPNFNKNDYKICEDLNINQSEYINIFNKNLLTENSIYNNLNFFDYSEKIIKLLNDKNKIIKTENILSDTQFSLRTDKQVYSFLTNQYVLPINEIYNKKLNKIQETIDIGCIGFNEINLFLNKIDDWCISRQNNYGHKLNDQNVLDTWFSSSLWPQIFCKKFNLINENIEINFITAYDIAFFWIFKMKIMNSINKNSIKINKIIYHGIICDQNGQKISKSKNNSYNIDFKNEEDFENYRGFLLLHNIFEKRIKIDDTKFIFCKKIKNKIRNIPNLFKKEIRNIYHFKSDLFNLSILKQIQKLIIKDEIHALKNSYNFFNFIKNDFSNIYIEMYKKYLNSTISEIKKYEIHDKFDEFLKSFYGLILKYIYCIFPKTSKELYTTYFKDDIEKNIDINKIIESSIYTNSELESIILIIKLKNNCNDIIVNTLCENFNNLINFNHNEEIKNKYSKFLNKEKLNDFQFISENIYLNCKDKNFLNDFLNKNKNI